MEAPEDRLLSEERKGKEEVWIKRFRVFHMGMEFGVAFHEGSFVVFAISVPEEYKELSKGHHFMAI
jgi:hypothetical protein